MPVQYPHNMITTSVIYKLDDRNESKGKYDNHLRVDEVRHERSVLPIR